MPKPRLSAQSQRRRPAQERRAPKGKGGLLRWMKGLLRRPLALQRRNGRWHLVLVDRRRPAAQLSLETQALCEELRERLLSQTHEAAGHALRHLVRVHDTLTQDGWPGVEALPSRTLGKALLQAQMLQDEQRSDALDDLLHRLRVMQVAAELREERSARPAPAPRAPVPLPDSQVEVSEATPEEYAASERSWVGTVPQKLPTDGS